MTDHWQELFQAPGQISPHNLHMIEIELHPDIWLSDFCDHISRVLDVIEKIIRPIARVDRFDQQRDVFGCRKVSRARQIVDEYAISRGTLFGRDLAGKAVNGAAADRARVVESTRKKSLPVFLPARHGRKP